MIDWQGWGVFGEGSGSIVAEEVGFMERYHTMPPRSFPLETLPISSLKHMQTLRHRGWLVVATTTTSALDRLVSR